MKRKMLALLMAVTMTAGLTACGGSDSGSQTTAGADSATTAAAETTTAAAKAETEAPKTASESSDGGYELALVTDLGTIDDKSFNQGAWEGMTKYAGESHISGRK